MHRTNRVSLALFLLLITAHTALAAPPPQHAAASQKANAAMSNDDVIVLVGAGLTDDVVIAKIKKSPNTNFDTSVTGLKALKAAGVSSGVIRVMIDPTAVAAPAPPPMPPGAYGPAGFAESDDPLQPHTGFYIETRGPDGKAHLRKILLTTSSGVKGPSFGSALGSAYSLGIHKMKTKLLVPGTTSEIQTSNASPTFWIYPGPDRSIQNTQLVQLEVKKDHREATGATIGGFSGVSAGGAEGASQGIKAERVQDGIYKVVVTSPLAVGSYAFIEGAGGSYRDFDVISGPV